MRKFKIYSLDMQPKFLNRWVPDHCLKVAVQRWETLRAREEPRDYPDFPLGLHIRDRDPEQWRK